MHETVLLGYLYDLERPLLRYVVGPSRLHGVVRHVAQLYAPIVHVVRAAVPQYGSRRSAGAYPGRDVAVVLFEPIGDVLKVHRLVLGVYRLLDRYDVHPYSVSALRYHLRDAGKRLEGHPLKEARNRGIFLYSVHGGVEKLRRSRHEERDLIPLYPRLSLNRPVVVVVVSVVVLENPYDGHLLQKVVKVLGLHILVHLLKILEGVGLSLLHLLKDAAHLGGEHLLEAPVLWVRGLDAHELVDENVRDLLAELTIALVRVFLALIAAYYFLVLFGHFFSLPSLFFECFQKVLKILRDLVHPLSGLRRHLNDFRIRVSEEDVLFALFEVEVEIREGVNLVYQNE